MLKYIRFRTEILFNAQIFFINALAELRLYLWNYIFKLAYLFDALFNPSKLWSRRFKIEIIIDDDIRNAAPDSNLLINIFKYIDSSNTQPSANIARTLSPPNILRPLLKENIIKASRFRLFDDIFIYFYIKKVNLLF